MIGFLLSHVWIKEGQNYKHDLIDRVLSHYRYNFPNQQIIISGHGIKPPKKILEQADYTIWCNQIIPSEVGRGHPKCVSEGLLLAKRLGWKQVFKNRADMVIGDKQIFQKIDASIRQGYQGVAFYEQNNIHDISIFADTNVLLDAWDQTKWDNSLRTNGVINCNNALRLNGHEPTKVFDIADNQWFTMVYLDPWWETLFVKMPDDIFLNNKFDISQFSFFHGYSKRAQCL